jgi:hypothetical protein
VVGSHKDSPGLNIESLQLRRVVNP